MAESPVRNENEQADAVTADLAAIVLRAGELGFSPVRVATALGVSASALASIEQQRRARR